MFIVLAVSIMYCMACYKSFYSADYVESHELDTIPAQQQNETQSESIVPPTQEAPLVLEENVYDEIISSSAASFPDPPPIPFATRKNVKNLTLDIPKIDCTPLDNVGIVKLNMRKFEFPIQPKLTTLNMNADADSEPKKK
jgi:hypothetical protein